MTTTITQSERQTLIDRIRCFPSELTDLTDEQLSAHPIEGEWSIRQVVHHMPDSHMNSLLRLKLMLTEGNPPMPVIDQDALANLYDVYNTPIEASLLILRGVHERWCDLMESLMDEQWRRTGQIPSGNPYNAEKLLQVYAWHCNNHLERIQALLTGSGAVN